MQNMTIKTKKRMMQEMAGIARTLIQVWVPLRLMFPETVTEITSGNPATATASSTRERDRRAGVAENESTPTASVAPLIGVASSNAMTGSIGKTCWVFENVDKEPYVK